MSHYTVYMANGDVLNLVRKWYDFWLFDSIGFMTFRDMEGQIVRVNRHFTIKVVHNNGAKAS